MTIRWPSLPGPFGAVSRVAGRLRFFYMPVALMAFVAVGVHAAADVLDDRVLGLVDRCDALFDTFLGSFSITEGLVDLVGSAERLKVARGVTLAWELAADLVLALPMLGYGETDEPPAGALLLRARPSWTDLWRQVWLKPGTLRVTRPLFVGAVALAAACNLAQLLQGTLTFALTPLGGRVISILALIAVLFVMATRAVLRALEDAHEASALLITPAARLRTGLVGTVVAAPLAAIALVDASPLLSFFR